MPDARQTHSLMSIARGRLTFLFTFITVALFLSACSILPIGKKDEQITLEYWGLWESPTVFNSIVNDYKTTHPNVNISYKMRTIEQYRETLESQVQTGKGPDIFRYHNTWVPMLKEELAPAPTDVISSSELKKSYYPVVDTDLRFRGKIVGLPMEIDGLALFYNDDIFRAAGVTKPPSTWTEFANVAAKLTVRDSTGNIRTAGAAIGTSSNVDHFSDILSVMILQNGGNPQSPTDKQSIDAVEYFTKFAKGANRVWDEAQPRSTVAFAGGSLAMYFGPSWRAIEIKNANPLLKFKTAPIPQLEGANVTWASYWAEGVSANSKYQKEAWEFLKYLTSDEVLIKLYSETTKSPGRFFGEPYPKLSLAEKLSTDPIIGAYISQGPFARSFPMASRTFDNGLNDLTIKAYEDAINSIGRGTETKNALETASKNISQVISRFNSPEQ